MWYNVGRLFEVMYHRSIILLIGVLLACVSNGLAASLEFDLRGDRISVDARNAPVREVLLAFSQAGVDTWLDPAIDATITSRFTDKDLEDALDRLLDSVNYVARWEVIKGPLGKYSRLAEIRVYRPGRESLATVIPRREDSWGDSATDSGSGRPRYRARELLLRLKPGTTQDEAKALLHELGGQIVGSIPAMGIYRVILTHNSDPMHMVEKYLDDPRVAALEPNYIIETPPAPALVDGLVPGELPAMPDGANPPPNGAVPVAVLDSGLNAIPGLGSVVVASYDITTLSTNISDPVGHGTQMALIAGGLVQPRGSEISAEETVPIIAIRVFDDNGTTSNYELLQCVSFSVQNGARVLNMSWYADAHSGFMDEVIEYALSEETVLVAAAGNTPSGVPVYPAATDGVLAVAAVEADGSIWESSNFGLFVDLSAPGTADMPVGYGGNPGAYAGTSIASAYTAKVLAQYLSLNPDSTSQEAIDALLASLSTGDESMSTDKYGAGVLDDAAVDRFLGTADADE